MYETTKASRRRLFEDKVLREGAEAGCQWAHQVGIKPGVMARWLVGLNPNNPCELLASEVRRG